MTANSIVRLVTNDDAIDELVRERFAALQETLACARFPFVQACASAKIVRHSSPQSARSNLRGGDRTLLIVLDANVRATGATKDPQDGALAAEFLRDFGNDQSNDRIPIMVLAQTTMEKVVFEALQRWDIGMWIPSAPASRNDTGAEQEKIAEILGGLKPGNYLRKRVITVSVGTKLAKYRLFDGHYTFEAESPYRTHHQPAQLIRQMKKFRPYIHGVVREDWQDILTDAGRDLYELVIEDIFGSNLMDKIKKDGKGVDIRFHVALGDHAEDVEDLFLLPFETVNSNSRPDGFFCACVPMARSMGQLTEVALPPEPNARLKVLLVVGAEGGPASIQSESTGARKAGKLGFLGRIDDVRKYLEQRRSSTSGTRHIDLDVLDESATKEIDFRSLLAAKLTKVDYDVVHFYGHSVADADGTFLFAPGASEPKARAISIREVALWIGDQTQKTRPPSLVFLSSCESGSVLTAVEMMNAGVTSVLGFRWEVKEDTAADYVRAFYRSYLELGRSITEAYRDACNVARVGNMGDPSWVAPIIVIAGHSSTTGARA
jgi:hypothetical protein